ncbi:hypothetical protein Dimus_004987 [Dionaea muscipula]
MALKRSFGSEIPSEVPNRTSLKHQKLENSDQISLNLHDVSSMDDPQRYYLLGDGTTRQNECDAGQKPASGKLHDCPERVEEEVANVLPRSLSLSPWASGSSSDDEYTADVVMHLPFVPECFSFDRAVRPFRHVEDAYHLLLEYPPRKRVPIGPEHQAEIPDLQPHREGDSHDDYNLQCSGTCVISFCESALPAYNGDNVGNGRGDCSCRDRGSFRCVRQHIEEAKQKLRSSLGPLAFSELGFNDMGEVVADKWSEDDEHLFHEVVFSNPASLGKNFWNALSSVFHSRTKMEIVSYYFNVFMLRKRAEQNRFVPMHIDSDNDEWQEIGDDDDNDDGGLTEDDEDSAVESPISHYGSLHYASCLAKEEDDDDDDEVCDDEDDNPVLVPRKDLAITGDPDFVFRPLGKIYCDEVREHDNQDGSCTSSDSGAPAQEGQGKPDCEQWREFTLEPCDSKVWDVYLSCPKNKVDLLPTCSMIKEVFGDGAFDLQGKRW